MIIDTLPHWHDLVRTEIERAYEFDLAIVPVLVGLPTCRPKSNFSNLCKRLPTNSPSVR